MARHSIRRPTSLRTQLMRSASVLAMVVALNHTPAKAQTLAVLNTAAAAARAATAVKFPNDCRQTSLPARAVRTCPIPPQCKGQSCAPFNINRA